VSDELFNGHRIRSLTVVDNFSRESLAITVDHRLNGYAVVATMNYLKISNGLPKRIQVDNGSEFISKVLDKWAYENYVTLDFSRPGTPTDNPFIESFNGSFRDECLNVHWFCFLRTLVIKLNDGVLATIDIAPIAPWAMLLRRSSEISTLKPKFSSFGCQRMGRGS